MKDEKLQAYIDELTQRGKIKVITPASKGNIPVLAASGLSLAEAWENSLLALYANGGSIRTQYDKKDSKGEFIDPPSLDCSMTMVIEAPLSEPMIHRCFPGGLDALEEYRQEICDGIKDHWIRDKNNPDDKRWEYTYHERLFAYKVPGVKEPINQIEKLIVMLTTYPETRRAQAITWQPWEDLGIGDPACLQSLWFRMQRDEMQVMRLNTNMRFRSRDSYDAAFMNTFAFIQLIDRIRSKVESRINETVLLGRFVDESDSYHIYGSRLDDFRNRFLKRVREKSFEDRTWTMNYARPIFEEAKPVIAEKIRKQDSQNLQHKK